MVGTRKRFSLAVVSVLVAATGGLLLLDGGWTLACPKTRASGFMDCGGQPDAVWRSDLPSWISLELSFGAMLVGAAGLTVAVVLERRGSRLARRSR